MKQKKYIVLIAIGIALLSGCDDSYATTTSSTSININASPLIMSAVTGVIPELNQNNSEAMFNRICQVAYGEVKPAVLRNELSQSGALKEKDSAFTQLVKGDDIKPYQTICAAYIIRSAGAIPDVNQYVTQQKNAEGQLITKADEAAVINLMPFRLATARATAELYAKIAADLPEKKAQSTGMYSQKASNLFAQSAANYLETVRKYNKEEMNHQYQLLLLQKGKFTFKSTTGYVLDITPEGMNLYLYGTPWLAEGYILGMTHSVDITL